MRVIESMEDQMNRTVTIDLGNNQFFKADKRVVEEYGIAAILRSIGREDTSPSGRVNVMQRGRLVGTVPATFDPIFIKSMSFLYEPRAGDFTRVGDHWEADKMLGPGDLEAVSGFIPSTSIT